MKSANIYSNGGALMSTVKASTDDFHRRLRELYPCVEDVSQLPHGWSAESKAPPLGLTDDNLGCYYRGNGRREEDEKFAAAVKTDNSIPPSCLLYYFEIKFISKGREGFMGLGLASTSAPSNKLPGWVRESYGYHADDGNIFYGDGRGSPFGPTFTSGDIIGCGYNLVEGKCFFTKNGLNLGKAFDDIPAETSFHPTIGLKTCGEEIYANFGQEDFAYDIEQDLRSLRKNMTLTISNYPITDFGPWQSTMHKLVQSWLLQNSYPNTADAFTKSTKLKCCKENMERVQLRYRVQQYVLSGRISEAIRLTNRLSPNLLQYNPNLLFALKCRQFIELINGADNDFQPIFNYIESNDHEISNNINSTTTTTTTTSNNGTISSNGLVKIDANGDQLAQPQQSTTNSISTSTTTSKGTASDGSPSNHHLNNSASNNGCNGMIGNNACEKVDDQHSTSSSSYQELMDIDQPLGVIMNHNNSNITDANNHNNNNNNNNDQSHHLHHNQQTRHRTPLGLNNSIYAKEQADHLSIASKLSPSNGSGPGLGSEGDTPSQSQTSLLVDTELDFNEQKFAKLILFGQELCDYLNQLDKLYGKNETNEKMLRDAIGLIAYINPKNSYHGKLLDPKERESISQILNSSILKAEMGDAYKSPMEDTMSKIRDMVRLNNSQGLWLVDNLY